MTKVIWLGEDSEDEPGPSWSVWCGLKFRKDVPVEVTDAHMLAKARANRYYKVIEDKEPQISRQETLEQFAADDSFEAARKKRHEEDEMADVKRVVRNKQEKPDAQTKAQELTDKAQDLKAKVERKKYNYRKAEKGSGYSPQKPKAKKEKAPDHPADNADP